jgi:hypothetical protein
MNILSILENSNKYDFIYTEDYKLNMNDSCLKYDEFNNFQLPPVEKYICNYEKVYKQNCINPTKAPILLRQYTIQPHKIHIECEHKFIETLDEIVIGVPYGWIPVLHLQNNEDLIIWYKEK